MTSPSFAELFDAALDNYGFTAGEVQQALARRGLKVNRTTLYRWRNGITEPGVGMTQILRYLPRVMDLSLPEEASFLEAAGRALGFDIRRKGPSQRTAVIDLPQRIHFGTQDLPPFAGRSDTLAELIASVRRFQPVLITGMGGVGKTRLAQEVLRLTVGRFGNGCEYLEITTGADNVQIVRNVAQLLNCGPDPSAITADNLHQVLAQMQDQLQGVRLLFLLDNVSSADQVRDLVRELTAVTWVLTARRISLKRIGVSTVHLQPLSLSEAIDVFQAHLRDSAVVDRRDLLCVSRVVEKLGRLPIALRLGASNLATGKLATVAELDQWLDAGGLRTGGALFSKLNRLLDWICAELPDEAQDLLRVCGAFPSPRIATMHLRSVSRRAGIRLSADVWDVLGDYSFVDYPDDHHVELHPLVHGYTQTKVRDSLEYTTIGPAFQEHFIDLAETFVSTGETRHDYRSLIADDEILWRVAESSYYEQAWTSLKRMWPTFSSYLWNVGDIVRYEVFDKWCLEAAQALDDEAWTAVLLSELGYVKWELSDWQEADTLISRAQAIHDNYPEQLLAQARLRRYRSMMILELGQFDQAVALLAEAEARLSQIDPATEKLLPTAWMLLHSARMTVHNKRDELAEAEAAGLTADHYFHTLVTAEGHTLDTYKVELGDILLRRDKVAEAEAQWEELVRRRTGMPDLQDHAEARLRLAWLAADRGDGAAAVKWASDALPTFTRFGNLARTRETERLIEQIIDADELPPFDGLFR